MELEMWQSSSIKELVTAIVKAQLAMKPAKRESSNPFFKSKYADLPECWEATHPFRENGIAIVQCPMPSDEKTIAIDTVMAHTSGEWMRSRLLMPIAKIDPQGAGSAITYGRRYALGCMTGLVTDEDNDGNIPKRQEDGARATLGEGASLSTKRGFGYQKASDAPAPIKPENGPVTQLPPAAVAPPQAQDNSGPYSPVSQATKVSPEAPSRAEAPAPSAAFVWRIGKDHKNESITTIPDEYLDWYVRKGTLPDHIDAARMELDRRNAQQVMEEDGNES
jgi:hypothetical protein